jgi:hypothetical protein
MTYETDRFDVLIEIQHIDTDLSFIVRFKFAPRCCICSTMGLGDDVTGMHSN